MTPKSERWGTPPTPPRSECRVSRWLWNSSSVVAYGRGAGRMDESTATARSRPYHTMLRRPRTTSVIEHSQRPSGQSTSASQ